ncbi:MAG: UDP-N-acetylmuramoyl-L-alanyl-D-glutamate--2,6-diaminopimelate ligase [Planctomycetes bacterium]|nr:UDP-N-acetylmuramoyl-L-alanyl-D-glutamate--2,6-diaminopimelate ligase [Planctomycetota bacterium]
MKTKGHNFTGLTLIKSVGAKNVVGSDEFEIAGVTSDSRCVKQGFAFFAMIGANVDGRTFIPDAISKGARAIVVGDEYAPPRDLERVTFIYVPDVYAALAAALDRFHDKPTKGANIIGVTGTNGKTTIATLIRHMYNYAGVKCSQFGTTGYFLPSRTIEPKETTPGMERLYSYFAESKSDGCKNVAMEVSSHALDQRRVEGIDFRAAIFTNITHDHLDYHKTLGEYIEAKLKLFRGLSSKSAAIINKDSKASELFCANVGGARLLTYGIEGSDLQASRVRYSDRGTSFTMHSPWGERQVDLRLVGSYNLYNALGALGAVMSTEPNSKRFDKFLSAAEMFTGAAGRMEAITEDEGYKVFVDYAHTPDAIENVCRTVKAFTKGRLIVVFGAGGNRDRKKRPEMGFAAQNYADIIILTSDNPRHEDPDDIIRDIRVGMDVRRDPIILTAREEAIRHGIMEARAGDVVLLLGKGHETYQQIEDIYYPFDDRQIARKYISQRNSQNGPV